MSLHPNIYDEGLVLTAAMRVAAGQIPHRDFYAIYGPAQFYVLAGLFKLFGASILVERLFDLFIKALLVAAVYATASLYCRKSVAAGTSAVAAFWVFGLLNETCGSAMTPVSLLNLIGSVLMLSVFRGPVPMRRLLAAGAVAGIATLFRYDTGIALLGINACVIAIAVYLRLSGTSTRMRAFSSTFWPYLLGFVLVILPPLLYYRSVAAFHPFIHDIFLFSGRYYHRNRNLPFPPISLEEFDNSAIYTTIVIVGISICVAALPSFGVPSNRVRNLLGDPEKQRWHGFLTAFGLLALGMYLKGFVRISLVHLFLSIIPSLLLLAILVEHRSTLPRAGRVSVMCLAWVFVLSAVWSAGREVKNLYSERSSLPKRVFSLVSRRSTELQKEWCKTSNSLTRGICFLPDDGRIQTVEFIASHTLPGQRLFVGLTSHDRIFANDNLIYFATQRLPATKWSHFDPGLQNRYDIQAEIIHELNSNAPPYIVRDSEFDSYSEPNESSKSSGVTLLDEYLHSEYQHIDTFGTMSVWQRKRAASLGCASAVGRSLLIGGRQHEDRGPRKYLNPVWNEAGLRRPQSHTADTHALEESDLALLLSMNQRSVELSTE
jgi:hypothetical protein